MYPTTMPPRFACQMTTDTPSRMYPTHSHETWLDGSGNGNTGVSAGHFHRIRNGQIQPDESDGHTHGMTMLPCGANAPKAITRRDGMLTVPEAGGMMPDGQYRLLGAEGGIQWRVVGMWALAAVFAAGAVVGTIMYVKHRREEAEE